MHSIHLRNLQPSDAERLAALANDENVSRYLVYTFPFPYTQRDAEWWIKEGSKENGATTKIIEWQGGPVGCIGLTPQIGWKAHLAEIGYWIGEEYWGQGIATAALAEMTSMAFNQLGFRKLFAPVLAVNTASTRVLEKNKFELEGVHKEEVIKNGRFYDIHHYARRRA